MALPGGLVRSDGVVDRTYSWRPIDGAVEAALAGAARSRLRPEAVSLALAGTLDRLAGTPATREAIDGLGVQDRRFLMIELAAALGLSFAWSTHACAACGAWFDVPLDLAELPVAPAGEDYPASVAMTSRGRVRLRLPTGADQIQVAASDDDAGAAALLAGLCASPEEPGPGTAFSAADLAVIDAALEELAPKLAWAVEAACSECRHVTVIPIDTTAWLRRMADGPTADVHEIAIEYGWSERDILALPRERRLKYLALIRGHGHDDSASLA